MWINAIRLAGWERSRCNEIYTGSLLGLREPKSTGWTGFEDGLASKGKFEGWLKARLPGDTEWRRVWTVILRGAGSNESVMSVTKKNRRSSLLSGFGRKVAAEVVIDDLPGGGTLSTMAFYATKPAKKEQPFCIAQHGKFSRCASRRMGADAFAPTSLLRRRHFPRVREANRHLLPLQDRRNVPESHGWLQGRLGSRRSRREAGIRVVDARRGRCVGDASLDRWLVGCFQGTPLNFRRRF